MPLVVLDPVTHSRLAQYASANNLSIDLAVIEVVSDWLDSREESYTESPALDAALPN